MSNLTLESVVAQWLAHLPLVLEVPGSIPAWVEENFESKHAFSSVICRDEVLRIGTLTGCPLCRESHSVCLYSLLFHLLCVTTRSQTVELWSNCDGATYQYRGKVTPFAG